MSIGNRTGHLPVGRNSAANGVTPVERLSMALTQWLPAAVVVAAILGLWEGYVRLFDVQRWLLPSPSIIAKTVAESPGLLWRHSLVTLEEVVVGFGLALAGGVLLASGIALSRTLERALYPFIIASQTIPIIVIAPLLLIWVGYGLTSKVIVVALIAFFRSSSTWSMASSRSTPMPSI